jgi:hypothetical protein
MAISIRYEQQWAFITDTNHGVPTGSVIEIRKADNAVYNARHFVIVVDVNTLIFYVGEQAITTVDTGLIAGPIEARRFTETFFSGVFYSGFGGLDLIQDYTYGVPLNISMDNVTDEIPDEVTGGA